MESRRQEKFQSSVRTEAQMNVLLTNAIEQSIGVFSVDLQQSEIDELLGLAAEAHTDPVGKINELRRIARQSGRSELKGVVNNIILTISEHLTKAERERFDRLGKTLLDDVE
ncbi:MAG: hypothetical protein RLZZ360_978 [Candidatus Parcubacteria bacterium]|jgi:hypothetical protein